MIIDTRPLTITRRYLFKKVFNVFVFLRGPAVFRLRPGFQELSYSARAMISTSHKTFLGRVFTATQLLAGFDVKYPA